MNTKTLNRQSGLTNERRLSEGRTLPESGESRSACHSFLLGMSRRGQQIGEYALLIAAISSALLMMYVYTKRGIQSTIKDLTDHEIGWQNDSVPILGSGAHQNMASTMQTKTRDTVHINKDPDFGTQYDIGSFSTSAGESNMTFNEV